MFSYETKASINNKKGGHEENIHNIKTMGTFEIFKASHKNRNILNSLY